MHCRGDDQMMLSRSLFGVAMALVAAVLWGTTGTAQSFAVGSTSPFWVGALRLVVASTFFGVIGAVGSRNPTKGAPLSSPLSSPACRLVLVSGVCIAAYNLAFFAGVQMSGVGLGTAIAIGSGPIWAGMLQSVLAKKAPPAEWWIGMSLAVAGGVALVATAQGLVAWTTRGLLLCLVAGLAYSSYALVSQRLVREFPPTVVVRWVFVVAACIAVPVATVLPGAFTPSWTNWLVVTYLGVAATGVSYLLFGHALRHISGATGVTLALAEPVTAFALSIWLLSYRPTVGGYVGLGLVLAGLLLVIRTELRAARPPAAPG
jgi:drug/metabolite transporter, DME family